jgi:hypothetical protein
LLHPTAVAEGDASPLTASERLRAKVDLAAQALVGPGGILLRHPRAREIVPRFLAAGYQVSRTAVPLMETALGRARELAPDDAVASGLAPYLQRHIPEEMHGDEPGGAALDDLVALGVDADDLRTRLPASKIAALVGAQYYWILHNHPVAVLGFLQLERFHPHEATVERLIEVTGLPREGFAQLLLHAELDVGHVEEQDRVVDSLPLEPYHERLIGVSALQTIGLFSEVLLDVVEEGAAGD